MKWQELILRGQQFLQFPDRTQARLDWCHGNADVPVLRASFENEKVLDLPNAVDVSEMLDAPRVFVIEGRRSDHVCLIGGPQAYSISNVGGIERTERLFREDRLAEYWSTLLFNRQEDLLVVYESGVLVLDDLFRVQLHHRKMVNDVLSNLGKSRISFVRDHETQWFMDLPDVKSKEDQPKI